MKNRQKSLYPNIVTCDCRHRKAIPSHIEAGLIHLVTSYHHAADRNRLFLRYDPVFINMRLIRLHIKSLRMLRSMHVEHWYKTS